MFGGDFLDILYKCLMFGIFESGGLIRSGKTKGTGRE